MSGGERATLRGSTVLIKPKPNVKPKKPKRKVTWEGRRATGITLPVPDKPGRIVRIRGTSGASLTAGKGSGKKKTKKKKPIPAARRGRASRGGKGKGGGK